MPDPVSAAEAEPGGSTQRIDTPIVWIDCEMTGLDLAADALVEIACVVTDGSLTEVDATGFTRVIRPPAAALAGMGDFVTEMHRTSGLLPLIEQGVELAQAQADLLAYVRTWVPEARKAPLAGSSVYVDRGFLARDMPDLDAHLHYRVIDVSSIKELVKRWYPKVYYAAPAKTGNHRALGDIRDSIEELRYYRSAIMLPL